jgi:iron complex transport system ATP-binding protein
MINSPLLEFSHVGFKYQPTGKPVLDDFNLVLESGTVTALLGPNGAGKTTLLYLILGWLKPQSGKILLNNRSLYGYSRRELGQWMALVPQNEHSAFEFSLLEYVSLGRAPYLPPLALPDESDYQIASDSLKRVGLGSMQDRSVLSLSGGEHQLLLVARTLAQNPSLLLLDEPTSHLDLSNKNRLVHLFRDLSSQGVTILFTTHEPDVASALATHLVLVQNGQVLETGALEKVYSSESLTRLHRLPLKVVNISGQRVVLWN